MEYRTLQLADKDAVEQVLAPLGRNDSALGFANLYSLTEKYGTEVRLEGRALHVRQRRRLPGAVAYYPPLGGEDVVADIARLLEEAAGAGERPVLVGVTPSQRQRLEEALPGMFAFSTDRAFADYLYRTRDIAAYAGSALAKKRRETNKFFQLYGDDVSFEPVVPACLDELRAFQQAWHEGSRRRGTEEHPLELEHRKIALDLDHFEALGLEGILLRIAGDVQGYAYGSLLPGGAFDVMVLKGNLDFRYIWRALLRELARTVAPPRRVPQPGGGPGPSRPAREQAELPALRPPGALPGNPGGRGGAVFRIGCLLPIPPRRVVQAASCSKPHPA